MENIELLKQEITSLDDVVVITAEAEAEYSEKIVKEFAILPLQLFSQLDKNYEVVYSELDGKHSETWADVKIHKNLTPNKIIEITQEFVRNVYEVITDSARKKLNIKYEDSCEFVKYAKNVINFIEKNYTIKDYFNSLDLESKGLFFEDTRYYNEYVDLIDGDYNVLGKINKNWSLSTQIERLNILLGWWNDGK